jgi:hypothetical protein
VQLEKEKLKFDLKWSTEEKKKKGILNVQPKYTYNMPKKLTSDNVVNMLKARDS